MAAKQGGSDYDSILKFLVIGDSGVGQTCVLMRFCEDTFQYQHLSTIGVDFKLKNIEVDGKLVQLQIWDTAGQQRFQTITQNYYKNSMGIALAYAINDKDTFNNVERWAKQINDFASQTVARVLIGNKADMPDRQVSYDEGKALADRYNIPFFQTSAQSGENVFKSFEALTREALQKQSNQVTPPVQNISHLTGGNSKKDKQGNCC